MKEKVEGEVEERYSVRIKSFYEGNEYYLFIYDTYTDVRLVGAPPSSIGKYGGDTDNWMWPRHTGDFSIFRVYAGPDNKPADYSENNVPLKPRKFLPINLKGVDKGDFTMVYGFPGRTTEYLTSYSVEQTYNVFNPANIAVRRKKLDIIESFMEQSAKIRIQYSSKQSRISNYWKKWIGENKGLKKLRAIEKKRDLETKFQAWANKTADRKKEYGDLLPQFQAIYADLKGMTMKRDFLNEAAFGIEAVLMSYRLNRLVTTSLDKEATAEQLKTLADGAKSRAAGFYKDYHAPADKQLMAAMLEMYANYIPKADQPDIFETINTKYKGDYEAYAEYVFKKSVIVDQEKLMPMLENYKASYGKKLSKDPAFVLMKSFLDDWRANAGPYFQKLDQVDALNNAYVRGLREMSPDKKFYPDANSTLRIAYGQVDDYKPYDGAYYKHKTTLEGIMQKYDPNNSDFQLPDQLLEVYKKKDFGRYEKDGTVTVCFTASNHTTGGNSGSPVIDGEGRLIGVNFDRNWEGTMSDIMYDPDRCRNISVDIGYVLFVVDKVCGAGHLVNEMKVIQ